MEPKKKNISNFLTNEDLQGKDYIENLQNNNIVNDQDETLRDVINQLEK